MNQLHIKYCHCEMAAHISTTVSLDKMLLLIDDKRSAWEHLVPHQLPNLGSIHLTRQEYVGSSQSLLSLGWLTKEETHLPMLSINEDLSFIQ